MVKPALMCGTVVQWFGRWTCDSNGRGFYIRPLRFQLTISGKLLTHTHVPALFTQAVEIGIGQRKVTTCGWEVTAGPAECTGSRRQVCTCVRDCQVESKSNTTLMTVDRSQPGYNLLNMRRNKGK